MILALAASLAFADDAKAPQITPFGQVYAQYGFDLTEGKENVNSFDLTRGYLGLDAELSDHVGARVLVDAGHDAVDPVLHVFVKNAWVEGKGFLPGVKARFGVVDTGYATYVDAFTGRRYLGKSLADASGLQSTADFGVNIQGKHKDGLIGWHVAALNGEGFKALDPSAGKALTARVTVDPLAPGKANVELPITAYVSENLEAAGTDSDAKLVYAGNLGFKFRKLIVFDGEYVGFSQGDVSGGGFSVFLAAGAPKYANFIVRFDQFDPDASVDDNEASTLRVGVDRYVTEKVAVAATYERSWTSVDPEATLVHGVFVKAQAGF